MSEMNFRCVAGGPKFESPPARDLHTRRVPPVGLVGKILFGGKMLTATCLNLNFCWPSANVDGANSRRF